MYLSQFHTPSTRCLFFSMFSLTFPRMALPVCVVCVWCVQYVVCYEACVFLILPGCAPPPDLLLVLLLICSFHPLPPKSPTRPCVGHTHIQTHTRSLVFFSHLSSFPIFLSGSSESSGLQRGRQREICRERNRDGAMEVEGGVVVGDLEGR